ncbi:hypothetical protein LguiA_030774 [Lonicera macranthoides]
MKKLQVLHLLTNHLSGQIPTSLGNLSFFSYVLLQDNKLEGTIPSTLDMDKSISLNMAQNSLVGPITSEVEDRRHSGWP